MNKFIPFLEEVKSKYPQHIKSHDNFNINEIKDKKPNNYESDLNKIKILFSLKSGIIFTDVGFVVPSSLTGVLRSRKRPTTLYSYKCLVGITTLPFKIWTDSWSQIRFEDVIIGELKSYTRNFEDKIFKVLKINYIDFVNKEEILRKEHEEQRLKELQVSQTKVLSELDKDGNGEVDVIEGNDFNLLLKKHQKSIVEVDRNYVQQFVKVSSYLKTKKRNIQSIFNSIKDTPNQEVLNEYVEILKDEIHTYNLVLFNSLNMIVSLVEDDIITFYEIHEMFDSLNMFDSKHEKDVSQKLTNIGDGLENLMYEIRDMGNKISNSIDELSYVTEESNRQLKNQLSEIDSTMKVGNLINTINTYQNYKNNKNTKSLRG